jgi:hypothetical protein
MWLTRGLVLGDEVRDPEVLASVALTVTAEALPPPRALLVHVLVDEDAGHRNSYRAIACAPLRLDAEEQTGVIQALELALELAPDEQQTIRRWLITRRWPAWARADPALRSLLGAPEPPVLLAEAARQSMIPLATLAKAALEERLPTIRAGDRQLVYLATIVEAQQRGLLHAGPGRPRRR